MVVLDELVGDPMLGQLIGARGFGEEAPLIGERSWRDQEGALKSCRHDFHEPEA
jgi:hypothetical protein